MKLKFISNLKNKLIMDFIEKWFAKLLLAFKAKNPKVWAAVSILLTVLMFGIQSVLPGITLPDFIPPDFLSLSWLVHVCGLPISDPAIGKIMWFLALLTGSKGTTAFLKPDKREKVIQESKQKIAQIEADKKF